MNDDVFDLSLKSYRRHASITPNPVPHTDVYKSVKLAAIKFTNKEYLEAICLSWILIKSDLNYTFAPYIIAYCYDNGLELKHDVKRAISFYLLSAHCGLYFSQFRLAQLYHLQAYENKLFNYNMAYVFYKHAYKNNEATFYEKIHITYCMAKLLFLMYIHRIKVDPSQVILLDPNDIKHILHIECSDLDNILTKGIKN